VTFGPDPVWVSTPQGPEMVTLTVTPTGGTAAAEEGAAGVTGGTAGAGVLGEGAAGVTVPTTKGGAAGAEGETVTAGPVGVGAATVGVVGGVTEGGVTGREGVVVPGTGSAGTRTGSLGCTSWWDVVAGAGRAGALVAVVGA